MNIEEHLGDNSNSFTAFDSLVTALHSNGIKIIVDEANNHSNPDSAGEYGSLYNNGVFMAAWNKTTLTVTSTTTPTSPITMTAISFSITSYPLSPI